MEYYDLPPIHPFTSQIVQLEDKLFDLQAEYDALTADHVEWTEAGEDRCIELEKEIKSIERQIDSLYYYE